MLIQKWPWRGMPIGAPCLIDLGLVGPGAGQPCRLPESGAAPRGRAVPRLPAPMRRRGTITLLVAMSIIGACLSHPPAAPGHAIVVESSPRHEESVANPKRLVLRFNSRLERKLCSVELVGPSRRTIALPRPEAGSTPDTLAYSLPPLEPGAYHARWKVMAADGHVTEGTVAFTVTGPTPGGKR